MWLWQTGRVIQKLGLALCYFVMQVQRWSQAQFSAGSVFATNKHEAVLPVAAQPGRCRANSSREIGKFCQVASADSLQSPLKPRVPRRTSHRLGARQAMPGAGTETGAGSWLPWPGSGARIRINVLRECGQGPQQLTQHFPSTVICGLAESPWYQSHILVSSVLISATTRRLGGEISWKSRLRYAGDTWKYNKV